MTPIIGGRSICTLRLYNSSYLYVCAAAQLTVLHVVAGANIERPESGISFFKIRGKVFHRIGSLFPQPGQNSNFSQIYIHQAGEQLDRRMSIFTGLRRHILAVLQSELHGLNPYVNHLMAAAAETADGAELDLVIRADTGDVDLRRYNNPRAADEVAALLPGEPLAAPRDIVLKPRHGGPLQFINETNAAYEPLHFPLIFPRGEPGWRLFMPQVHNPKPNPVYVAAQQLQQRRLTMLQHLQQQSQLENPDQPQPSYADLQRQLMEQIRALPLPQPSTADEIEAAAGLGIDEAEEGRLELHDSHYLCTQCSSFALSAALSCAAMWLCGLQCCLPYVAVCCRDPDDLEVDEDDGHDAVARAEARSRNVTAMQFAAFRMHERVNDPNDNNHLKWGLLFQVGCLPVLHLLCCLPFCPKQRCAILLKSCCFCCNNLRVSDFKTHSCTDALHPDCHQSLASVWLLT